MTHADRMAVYQKARDLRQKIYITCWAGISALPLKGHIKRSILRRAIRASRHIDRIDRYMENFRKGNRREDSVNEKCEHRRYEELRESQGPRDQNAVMFVCLDCGHEWGHEVDVESPDLDGLS